MKNTTAKQIRGMSYETLTERLDALASIINKLTADYRHVFECDEKLCTMVQDEINDIVDELERRENEG
jgi:galactose-1-phosphate uridylyltransferase